MSYAGLTGGEGKAGVGFGRMDFVVGIWLLDILRSPSLEVELDCWKKLACMSWTRFDSSPSVFGQGVVVLFVARAGRGRGVRRGVDWRGAGAGEAESWGGREGLLLLDSRSDSGSLESSERMRDARGGAPSDSGAESSSVAAETRAFARFLLVNRGGEAEPLEVDASESELDSNPNLAIVPRETSCVGARNSRIAVFLRPTR